MKKIICIAALVVLVASIGTAQTVKIAYVNSETILRELPEAQQVKKELEATIKGWQDELERMGKELQDGLEDYQKKQALLDPKIKADKEKSLQDLQQKAREYQYQKFDQREGEAVKLREKKFAPIQERVMKTIEKVAKEDGFNYVFDKLEAATNLLYADSKFDLTYKVIDQLKRGFASPVPTKSK
ncbi:MAG: OmpH family outer membrane protein [Ignavibacteriales bacterium]|nr:OmpH family outer membrane protein [Ignavibacteriales bacterium]